MKKSNKLIDYWLTITLVVTVCFLFSMAVSKESMILGFCAFGVAICGLLLKRILK